MMRLIDDRISSTERRRDRKRKNATAGQSGSQSVLSRVTAAHDIDVGDTLIVVPLYPACLQPVIEIRSALSFGKFAEQSVHHLRSAIPALRSKLGLEHERPLIVHLAPNIRHT
jgi:hypothetical protein